MTICARTWSAARGAVGAVAAAAAAATTMLAAGCGLPAPGAQPKLWTLFDFDRLSQGVAAGQPGPSLAPAAGLPGGVPVQSFVTQAGGAPVLTVGRSWAAGKPAAYFTTEMWSGFDEVWVQPAYVPITGMNDDGTPKKLLGDDGAWHPIFSVGPASAFYGPYWQIVYFQVPEGTPPTAFTSGRQVIESGLPLVKGEAHVMALAPDAIAPPAADPLIPIMAPQPQRGWLDGAPISFVSLGVGSFTWDPADRVVRESPLYVFVKRDGDGKLVAQGAPSVGGPGPAGHFRPAPPLLPSGAPAYGALWRVYTVELPPAGGTYAPIAGNPLHLAGTADVACAATDPSTCVPLTSEAVIEKVIDPASIRRTELLITCPFISFDGTAVTL